MRVSQQPLVSIVIPVYNGANYLREAIDSALSQTYPNIEVLVVNDGSTDDGATEEIALSYRDKIRYFRKENGGVSSALNFGIRQMQGEYFAWLSHDDIHLPQKVEKQMDAVFRYKGNKPAICVCNYFLIDEAGREFMRTPQNIGPYFQRSLRCFLGGETALMIDGDATLISKQVFDTCGFFDEALFASQETDMWFRASEVAEFLFIPEYLVGYRSHSQQVTHKRKKDVGLEAGAFRGSLMRQATLQEIQEYIGNETDAFRFGSSVYHYMRLYFYDASHAMIEKLRQLCKADWKYLGNMLAGMFESMDIDTIKKALMNDVNRESNKPKILLYCKEWASGGLADKLTALIKTLRKTYEIILAYSGQGGETFPPGITPICLQPYAAGNCLHHAICLALLADVLNVDLLWCNAANLIPDAMAFSFLKRSPICTVASVHYCEPTVGVFEILQNYDDDIASVADASIVSIEDHEMMFAQYFYPYDAVVLPTLSSNQASLDAWSLLVQTALSPADERDVLRERFPQLSGLQNAVQPADIIEKIKPYLEKYEKYALAKQQAYYEQSIYWIITKPLRWIADRLKQLARHGG